MKKLYRDDLTEEQATTLVVQALYDAADDDSATGGPDVARRIYPIVTVITEDGFRRLTEDGVLRDRPLDPGAAAGAARRPAGRAALSARLVLLPGCTQSLDRKGRIAGVDAVLCLTPAGHGRPGGVRPQGHRPRPQPGRAAVRRRHRVRRREPVPRAAQVQRDLRPDRLRGRRQVQRVREPADRRCALRRSARIHLRP